ncbi:hypothetical protein PLICRDRAFT_60360, partial [Plicaturopsis crispa FD-325 SS-3]
MIERRDYLRVTSAPVPDDTFVSIIISSMPDIYRPTIQTVETTTKVSGTTITPETLMSIITQEAEHRVIEREKSRHAEAAMLALQSSSKKSKKGGKGKPKGSGTNVCENCKKVGSHTKEDCWAPGGGKEGQGPYQKGKKKEDAANTATVRDDVFAFTAPPTSEQNPLCSARPHALDAILDSGASRHFCPDRAKFTNYQAANRMINVADGRTFKAAGMGDV